MKKLGICAAITLAVVGNFVSQPLTAATTYAAYGAPITPAQARHLRDSNKKLSRQLGVSFKLIQSISKIIGVNTPNSQFTYNAFVEEIRKKAIEAKDLRSEVRHLQEVVAKWENLALRNPTSNALELAGKAIDEGRLSDAATELRKLEQLRKSESADAHELWKQAVESQARLAMLQLDEDSATTLYDEAAAYSGELKRKAHLDEWSMSLCAATAQLTKGRRRLELKPLLAALDRLNNVVLPLVPQDQFPEQWAGTQLQVAQTLAHIAKFRSDETSRSEFLKALDTFNKALVQFEKMGSTKNIVAAHLQLAELHGYLATLYGGDTGWQSLTIAENSLSKVLEIHPKETQVDDWAIIQSNLGGILRTRALYFTGQERREILDRSIAAYNAALSVQSKQKSPCCWAPTKNNLALTLMMKSALSSREVAIDLLDQAIENLNDAQSVFTKEFDVNEWSRIQDNLGNAFNSKANLVSDDLAIPLLEKAISAHEAALSIRQRDRSQILWSNSQTNYGGDLFNFAFRHTGETRLLLLHRAISAYEASLSAITKESSSRDWASTQHNLGLAYYHMGLLLKNDERIDYLEKSVSALKDALLVRITAKSPAQLMETKSKLEMALLELSLLPSDSKDWKIMEEAFAALANADI